MAVSGATTYGTYTASPQLNLRSSSTGSSAGSSFCPTCGTNQTAKIGQSYSNGYTGRSSTDGYVCTTCGKSGAQSSGSYSASTYCPTCGGRSNSSYCPTCSNSGGGSSYSGPFAGGNTSSNSRNSIVTGLSWAR